MTKPRSPSVASGASAVDQLNESPQAQEPVAFGLSIVKPCFSMVSTKSIEAPFRYGALIRSVTTFTPPKLGDHVAVELTLVEEQLVPQAGATTRLHGDPQREVVATFLVEQRLHLGGGPVGEDHTRGDGLLGLRFSHS